jgi:hypothetical protein
MQVERQGKRIHPSIRREALHREGDSAVRGSLADGLISELEKKAVVSQRTCPCSPLAGGIRQGHNSRMRALVGVLVAAAIFFGIYHFYLKKMPTTDEGAASTQAISLTGVRGDLLQIAQAERGYIATNGHCAALDELVSSNSLSLSRSERDGYSYSVECSSGDFTAIARHAPAPAGSPIRYPSLGVDANMQIHEVN